MIVKLFRSEDEVKINGVARTVDLSGLDENIQQLFMIIETGVGIITFTDKPKEYLGLDEFNRLYSRYIQKWKVAGA